MESFNKIKALIEGVEADIIKSDSGQKAAIQRVRKVAQEVKKLCKELRDEAQSLKGKKV